METRTKNVRELPAPPRVFIGDTTQTSSRARRLKSEENPNNGGLMKNLLRMPVNVAGCLLKANNTELDLKVHVFGAKPIVDIKIGGCTEGPSRRPCLGKCMKSSLLTALHNTHIMYVCAFVSFDWQEIHRSCLSSGFARCRDC